MRRSDDIRPSIPRRFQFRRRIFDARDLAAVDVSLRASESKCATRISNTPFNYLSMRWMFLVA